MIQLRVITPRGMLLTSLLLYVLVAGVGAYLATVVDTWPQVALLAGAGP